MVICAWPSDIIQADHPRSIFFFVGALQCDLKMAAGCHLRGVAAAAADYFRPNSEPSLADTLRPSC